MADHDAFVWQPYTKVLDSLQGMPWTKWFLDGRFNLAHNCLDRHVRAGNGDRLARIWEGEGGQSRRITYREIYAESMFGVKLDCSPRAQATV